MTHTEAVAMYWRVQVWDLTVSGSGASAIGHLHTVDDGSYDFSVTDLNDDSTYCTVPNDVRERDLTLSGFRGFNHKGKLYGVQTLPGDPYPDYPFVANAHVTVGGPTVGVGMKVICDIDSPLDYYVSFGDITASSGASYWDQYSGASASLSTCIFLVAQPPYSLYEHYDWSEFYYPTTTMKSGPDGSIPLNITLPGGRNISSNCELYQNLSSVYYGDSTSQLSAGSITSLTLAPSKYWP
ncbi:MAG: hypothetical protein WCO97_11280, partial [bacterium]